MTFAPTLATGNPGEHTASAVGTALTGGPPHRPRRAVFPHRVPRLYSLPRYKASRSCDHSPTADLGDAGSRYRDKIEHLSKTTPSVTAAFAASPVKPLESALLGPVKETIQQARVASNSIIVV